MKFELRGSTRLSNYLATFELRASSRSVNYLVTFEARSGEAQNFKLERSNYFQRSVSPKIDENLSLKVRKSMFARKFNKKSRPGALFWAKGRFLVDFGVPEGTQKLPKSYEAPGGMGFEARLFERIH